MLTVTQCWIREFKPNKVRGLGNHSRLSDKTHKGSLSGGKDYTLRVSTLVKG